MRNIAQLNLTTAAAATEATAETPTRTCRQDATVAREDRVSVLSQMAQADSLAVHQDLEVAAAKPRIDGTLVAKT